MLENNQGQFLSFEFENDHPVSRALEDWQKAIATTEVRGNITTYAWATHYRGKYIHRHKGGRPKKGWQGKHQHVIGSRYLKLLKEIKNAKITYLAVEDRIDNGILEQRLCYEFTTQGD
jgi:hypothetical protein